MSVTLRPGVRTNPVCLVCSLFRTHSFLIQGCENHNWTLSLYLHTYHIHLKSHVFYQLQWRKQFRTCEILTTVIWIKSLEPECSSPRPLDTVPNFFYCCRFIWSDLQRIWQLSSQLRRIIIFKDRSRSVQRHSPPSHVLDHIWQVIFALLRYSPRTERPNQPNTNCWVKKWKP